MCLVIAKKSSITNNSVQKLQKHFLLSIYRYCRARCFGEEVGDERDDERDTSDNLDPLDPLDLPKYITDPVGGLPILLKSTLELCAEVGAEGEP